ncbi:phage antirepressor KilAC domain-containing protein [Staphylococcus felis]|uniref:phage antirepressor KilAC domain-containing protein n=1 Tax=Staphylococcus felis TaxID=46127 RepID=UPI00396776BF
MQVLQDKTNVEQMFNIKEKKNGEIAISARELYNALNIKKRFSEWAKTNLKHFKEDRDFTSVLSSTVVNNGAVRQLNDYALTLDVAKHIALMSGSKKGFEFREYFIQVEKAWNSPEMVMQRALKIANNTILQLETQIEKDKPKVIFADAVDTSTSSILVGELAKLISQNGIKIGQNRLFQWLRDNGYLIKKQGEAYNLPTQRSMDLKIMDIKKRTQNNPDGSIRVTRTTKITGKGQQYFINKFLSKKVSN